MAVSDARHLTLGRSEGQRLPAAQAHAVTAAAEEVSLHGFDLGLAIAAGLVALGGIVGGLGIQTLRSATDDIRAESCARGNWSARALGSAGWSTPERPQSSLSKLDAVGLLSARSGRVADHQSGPVRPASGSCF